MEKKELLPGDQGGGTEDNMAAWLLGVKNIAIRPYPLPSLGPNDVKVRIKALGICGSDVHYFKTMRCASFVISKPMVLGHESAGIIEAIGSEVKSLAVGDRVALEPGINCQQCPLCLLGRYNLCRHMKFLGSAPNNGCFTNKLVHPSRLCFKLPDNVTLEEGAMCEPLSVGVHACRRADVSSNTTVLIMGAGPIGLIVLLVARAFGVPRIVITDIDVRRLAFAKELGADETIHVSTNIQDVDEEVVRIRDGMGGDVDVSFDCVGYDKTMSTAINATRSAGKVCAIGLGESEDMTLPLTQATIREVDVIGIFRYRDTWPVCIELLQTGKIDVKPLITNRFGFTQKEVEEAFATSAGGGNAIKVMFNL